jgi:hypothetical protein
MKSNFKVAIITAIGAILIASLGTFFYLNRNSHKPVQTEPTKPSETIERRAGDPSTRGGSATVRQAFLKPTDDPLTTNDESNDQPLGYFGSVTLYVRNIDSGNSYPLDADVEESEDGFELKRLYFPKGGWVDFYTCDLNSVYEGHCTDENGRAWSINGEY